MASRIQVSPTAEIRDAGALSRICTPGVADDCRAIADDPGAARRLTSYPVVTSGTPRFAAFSVAYLIAAGLCAAGALLTALLGRGSRRGDKPG